MTTRRINLTTATPTQAGRISTIKLVSQSVTGPQGSPGGPDTYAPETYGATGDGTTDDTAAIQAAWNAAAVSGGCVAFSAKTYLVLGALVGPYDIASPYACRPVRWQGVGADMFSPETSTRNPSGGTILDLRYSTGPACIDLRGDGHMEITGITFWQNGATAHANPYIQTTNTRLDVHHCTFFGHPTKLTTLCDQDAIVLGGTTQTIGTGSDAPFQGYGTVISANHFQRIRRAVHGRTYCNGVVIRDNNIWHLCGSSVASAIGAIEFEGISVSYCTGNVVANNLIEMSGYVYGVRLRNYCLATRVDGNNFYDLGANAVAPVRVDANALQTFVIAGYAATTVDHLSDAGTRTTFLHNNGNGNEYQVVSSRTKFTDESGIEFTGSAIKATASNGLAVQPAADVSDSVVPLSVKRSAAASSNPGTTVLQLLQSGALTIGGSAAGTITFKDAAGTTLATFSNALKTWTASGTGGNMLIDSGSGGSYITLKGYGWKLADYLGTNTIYMRVGTGTPEGNYAAPVGSLFYRVDGSAGTILYVKESGASTTGWAAVRTGPSPEFTTIAMSDETTAITTGTAKVTWRAPMAMTLTAVRASLTTASSSGTPTVDINEGGVSILSTKLTIDANELTSTTAATAAVISDAAIADDAELTFDIDVAGTGAKGLKVTLYWVRA